MFHNLSVKGLNYAEKKIKKSPCTPWFSGSHFMSWQALHPLFDGEKKCYLPGILKESESEKEKGRED